MRVTRGVGWFQEVGEVPEVGVGPRGRGAPKRHRRFEVREVSEMEVVLEMGEEFRTRTSQETTRVKLNQLVDHAGKRLVRRNHGST